MQRNEHIRGLISEGFTFFKRGMLGTLTIGSNTYHVSMNAKFSCMSMLAKVFRGMQPHAKGVLFLARVCQRVLGNLGHGKMF